jgi:hypothetical protein
MRTLGETARNSLVLKEIGIFLSRVTARGWKMGKRLKMRNEAGDDAPTEADSVMAQYDPEIQKLINSARSLLRTAFPGATETADPKAKLLGYSYGPGYKGTVATLILSKTGVKIGIPYGASLPDPAGLLAGQGKVHRHVAVTTTAELKSSALKALLKASLSAWRQRTGKI